MKTASAVLSKTGVTPLQLGALVITFHRPPLAPAAPDHVRVAAGRAVGRARAAAKMRDVRSFMAWVGDSRG